MSYQRGSIRTLHRKGGDIWVLRYRVTQPDGSRMEKIEHIGLVRDFPKERDARREADRLGLFVRINEPQRDTRIRFDALAEHYLKNDFGADAVRPKTERTTLNTQQIVGGYLIPRWGKEIADDIKPLDIQRWLKSLHTELFPFSITRSELTLGLPQPHDDDALAQTAREKAARPAHHRGAPGAHRQAPGGTARRRRGQSSVHP